MNFASDTAKRAAFSIFAIALHIISYLAIVEASSPQSLPPPPAATMDSVEYSKNELKEMNHVWKVIRKSCSGCWSGSISAYSVARGRYNQQPRLVLQKGGRERNFQLQVNLKQQQGTWTVWNLMTKGDQFIVPLSCIPTTRHTQLKIGFDEGIVLRIPQSWTAVPRIVFEIGFWDPSGDGIRRTAVVEYDAMAKRKWWRMRFVAKGQGLEEITVVQMKREKPTTIVGNTTDPQAIHVLPLEAPFPMTDLNMNELEATRKETVDLQTMERTKSSKLDSDESKQVLDLVVTSLLGDTSQEDNKRCFRQVLPCGICASIPQRLIANDKVECVFAHQWKNGAFQALHVEYDAVTAEAVRVTLYSFQRKKSAR